MALSYSWDMPLSSARRTVVLLSRVKVLLRCCESRGTPGALQHDGAYGPVAFVYPGPQSHPNRRTSLQSDRITWRVSRRMLRMTEMFWFLAPLPSPPRMLLMR